MRLAEFIVHDMDGIIAEWEAFAATQLPGAGGMTPRALRDHAPAILKAIAGDLATSQTRWEQSEKSKGRAHSEQGAPETAAQTHAVLRARNGFDIIQLVAEYRALRASVLRRWQDAKSLDHHELAEVIRFNEALDQAVAESVAHFQDQVETSRNLLLAMLGHDMRTPLSNVLMTAHYLSQLQAGDAVAAAAGRLMRSGVSLRALIDDLSTFGRTSLGLGLDLARGDLDLAAAVLDEVEQLRGAHPKRRIELETSGDTHGQWDGPRLQQLLRNLVSNALRYGASDTPVRVELRGEHDPVLLQVTNTGATLDAAAFGALFGPLQRGTALPDSEDSRDSLGLGLYIVREVAQAHGGDVAVQADGGLTTFSVHLPRRAPEAGQG